MLEPIAGILSVKIFIRAAEFRKVLKSEDCKVDLKKLFLSAAAVLTAAGVSAAEIEFKAPLTGSEWKLVENSPLRCTLEHKIPDYGSVMFTSAAGKNQNMSFSHLGGRQKPEYEFQAQINQGAGAVWYG